MLKLIRADLYKSFHRAYVFVLMGVMAVSALLCSVIFGRSGMGISALPSVLELAGIPMLFISMFVDIVTAEENKEHTLKNTVSFGISRTKLYITKNISAIIIALAVAIETLAVFLASAFLLLKPEKIDYAALLSDFGIRIATAFLIYIAAIVLGTFLATMFKRNSLFAFVYVGAMLLPNILFQLLNRVNPVFGKINEMMLFSQIQIITKADMFYLGMAAWVSLAHILVFMILGLTISKKQEIN